jgi:hypothetical protein
MNTGINQRGELAFSFIAQGFILRRPAEKG